MGKWESSTLRGAEVLAGEGVEKEVWGEDKKAQDRMLGAEGAHQRLPGEAQGAWRTRTRQCSVMGGWRGESF